jgi:aspartate ammonia-lyase
MVKHLRAITGLDLREGTDRVQLMQSMGDAAALSGALRTYAVDLGKIASDLRLLVSGPRTGFAEIRLPAVQPGSSIMPGKVNPSIAEMVNMVCFQAIGNDVTIATAAEAGQLELNVMMPLIAHNLFSPSGSYDGEPRLPSGAWTGSRRTGRCARTGSIEVRRS